MRVDEPDDPIGADLTADEKDRNWMQYGPLDATERFHEWSEQKTRTKTAEVQRKLRTLRTDK